MKVIVGVDIGGTKLKFGLFSESAELLKKWDCITDLSNRGNNIIPSIANNIKYILSEFQLNMEDILGIGMGIPGPIDAHGYVKSCVNLHWNDINPVQEMKRFFPKSLVLAGNDANMAALGEYYKGAGSEYNSMMLITLGTGVGGGIIIDGKIMTGSHGLAGEIGHITAYPDEQSKCNCGNSGCIDQFASATGIISYMHNLLDNTFVPSKLREIKDFSPKEICKFAVEGDVLAEKCLKKCLGALGIGLACFSHAFDPEVFIIGGGVSHNGQIILDMIQNEYLKHIFLVNKAADIRLAKLGNDAGIIGGFMLITEELDIV